MASTVEQDSFKANFADKLREKIEHDGLGVRPGIEKEIAEHFVNALMEFKSKLEADFKTHQQVKGEVSWSVERQRIIADFAVNLDNVFAAIGGIKPKESSAFWSGRGVKRAEEFGVDFASTIPGFIVNQVSSALKDIFTKKAYSADGLVDTATFIGMWEAMSKLYAEGTFADAHIFLVDGETSQQSVLWNTELHTLRQRQEQGEVSKIWIHTLSPEVLKEYQSLLKEKDALGKDHESLKLMDNKIERLLKNENNWVKSELDDSATFKLKISGFTEPYKTVSYQDLKSAGRLVKQYSDNLQERKKNPHGYLDEKYKKPLAHISEIIAEKKDLEIAFLELKLLRNKIKSEKTMDEPLRSGLQEMSKIIAAKIETVKSIISNEETPDFEVISRLEK